MAERKRSRGSGRFRFAPFLLSLSMGFSLAAMNVAAKGEEISSPLDRLSELLQEARQDIHEHVVGDGEGAADFVRGQEGSRAGEREYFDKFDMDGDGLFNLEEYQRAMIEDLEASGTGGNLEDANGRSSIGSIAGRYMEELAEQFGQEDEDKDGKVSFEEWWNAVRRSRDGEGDAAPPVQDYSEEELKFIFHMLDGNADGQLSASELAKGLDMEGEKMTERQTEVIQGMDLNKDGTVNITEYLESYSSRSSEAVYASLVKTFQALDEDYVKKNFEKSQQDGNKSN
eukprot:758819-Hanusia_phi.AAC.8